MISSTLHVFILAEHFSFGTIISIGIRRFSFLSWYFSYCSSVLITSDGSARKYKDYIPQFEVPVYVKHQKTKQVQIIVYDDTFIETLETFIIEINGTDVGDGIRKVTVTIKDDDG